MPANVDYADTLHTGLHTFERTPTVPASSFGDTQIGTTNPIGANKVKHQHHKQLSQAHGSAAAAERRVVHVARAAGTVESFEAGVVVAAVGDSTATADLYKNGASILTAAVEIDSGDAAYAEVAGAISSAAYVAGDVFEVVVTVAAGTGTLPQGLYAAAVLRESPGA